MRYSLLEIAILTTVIFGILMVGYSYFIFRMAEIAEAEKERKRIEEERKKNPFYGIYEELDD